MPRVTLLERVREIYRAAQERDWVLVLRRLEEVHERVRGLQKKLRAYREKYGELDDGG